MTDNFTSPVQTRGSFRVWANLSLRYKLVLLFLAVALLAVGTITFLNVRSTSAALTAQANENMTALAVSEARNIGTLLAKRVNAMQAFALHEHTQEGVAVQNGDYSGGTEAILSELAKLDEQWAAASDDDALVRERLSNELAHELKNFTTIVPDFAEAFLTDRYGGLVAASDRTSDYYQADEEWWQAAYNDGNGAVFIALPELDESTGVIGIDMATPVYDQSNEIIGIMRTTLNVTALIDRLAEFELGETGEAHLLLEGEVFVGPGGEPEFFDDSAALTQPGTAPQGAIETSYDGRPSLVGYATISSPMGEQFISDLGWKVFIHQDQEEALSAVALQTRNTGLLALLIAGIAAVAAVVMGQVLAAPIANLTNAVTRFTAGDMDARAKSRSSDEIGTLATNFNQMAERVGSLLTDIQRRSEELAERTRELEASQRVTFAASERTTPDELLGLVVDLVRDQFDLYHAQVYLVDEEKQAAVLRQSTGYAGSQLLQKGHQIPLDAAALVTRAIHTGEPVLVDDVNQAEDWLPNPLLPETQSELAVPLKVGDRVIGVLDAQDMTPGRFTESTVALFQTMAGQIAFLFENNELLERVTEQTETLTVFTTQLRTAAEIARQAGTVLDPESLLQRVVELMQSRFGLYHAHIYVLDEATGQLTVRAGSGEVGRVLRERGHAIPLDREKSLVARAARTQHPVLVEDTTLEPDFMPNPLLPQTRAELAVPLVAGGKTLGVLDMQDDQVGRFTESDLDTYSTLAGQIATALQNAGLFKDIRTSEARFRDVALTTSDWVWETDAQGRYTYCSDKVVDVLGHTAEEMLGKTPFDFMPEEEAARVGEVFGEIVTHKKPIVDLENRNITADGREIYLLTNGVPLLDEEGNLLGYRGVDKDITERKRAQEALQESAARFRTLFDFAPEGVMVIDVDKLAFDDVNERALELFGYTRQELLKTSPLAVSAEVQPDGRSAMEVMSEAIQGAMAGGSPRLEALYVRSSGKEFPVDVQVVKLPEADRNLVRVSFSDITERKQAEEELRRLGSAVEQSIDGTAVSDLDGKIQFINPAWAQMHGYSVEELQGKHLSMFHTKEQLQKDVGPFNERVMETGAHQGEVGHVRKDGTTFPTWMTTTLFKDERGTPVGLVGTARDITERKRAEMERQRFTTQLRAAADLAERINAILNPDELLNEVVAQLQSSFDLYHVHVYLLDEAQRDLVMRSGSGEVGQKMLQQGHSIPLDQEKSLVARAARSREIVSVADTTTAPDFMPNPLLPDTRSEVATPLVVGDQVLGVLDVQDSQKGRFTQADLDIFSTLAGQIATALQNAGYVEQVETRLRISQVLAGAQTEDEVLDALIQQTGIYPNTQPSIFTVAPEAEELTLIVRRQADFDSGLPVMEEEMHLPLSQFPSLQDSVEGKVFISPNLLLDQDVDPPVREIARMTGTRSVMTLPLTFGGEYLGVLSVSSQKEGYFDERKLRLYETLAEQGAAALRTARLYEETQKAAEQVREADRRKSEFLADMSHELRTPLNSIIGYTELMLMGVSEIDPDTLEDVQAIYDNGKHLLRIINDILDLAKIEAGRMELEMEKVHIPALLDEVKTSNAGLLVNKPVEILTEAEQGVPPIEADRVRLSQILNNLIGNAIKFTEEGSITMRAYVDHGGQGEKDEWVCIEVQDTGTGMSEGDLQKIFERFRRAGSSLTRRAEGTGLGLDITRHLVEMHGGTIDARSNPGAGSTFTVRLPVRQGSEIGD